MKLRMLFPFALLLCLSFISLNAQQDVPRKARKSFEAAREHYLRLEWGAMENALNEAIQAFPNFAEARIFRAEWRMDRGNLEEAIQDYKMAYLADTAAYLGVLNVLANLYLEQGLPDSSLWAQQKFLARARLSPDKKALLLERLEKTKRSLELMKEAIAFEPENLGEEINSADGEYHCSFTVDGLEMIFTVREAYRGGCPAPMMRQEENFYVAYEENGNWVRRRPLGPPINTPCNEGAGRISPDGNYLFFAASHGPNSLGRMDIYYAKRVNGSWQKPENLGPAVNSPHWDSQPAFAPDGKTLYFVSTRPGGVGKEDIWCSELRPDGSWTPAKNLGPTINSTENDFSPFIHANNIDFYFASFGFPGLGGADLFVAQKNADGSFSEPRNLGYPLNTTKDERSLVISADGLTGYYASNNQEGFGDFDLFRFQTDPSYRPKPATWMGGVITADGGLPATKIELIDLETGQPTATTHPDPVSGRYLLPLPTGRKYGLNISSPGFLFHSEHVQLDSNHQKFEPFKKNVKLERVDTGKSVVLKNIFFDTDRFELKETSYPELQKLKNFLSDNPTLRIQIEGHTDNQGDRAHNQTLSENRAIAVKSWLLNQGISADRLMAKGYADTRPVADNNSPEGRAQNRRTAFRIIP